MRVDLSEELKRIAGSLDLPEEIAEEAVLAYEEVGEWLAADDSTLAQYRPEIYPQGSFRIGTLIRPLKADDFDIDLVCRLDIQKESTTQKELKKIVGDQLRANADLKARIKEKRRCWTLLYGNRFHLDVLPSIPDQDGVPTAILLTDRALTRWQFSNPKGYAEWFIGRAGTFFLDVRKRLATEAETTVEDVPEWRVRTPLQRIVQLLKRHRDVAFENDADHCPPSILITTLAARAYAGEENLHVGLLNAVRGIPSAIENRNGRYWVPNPAHENENFADKWNENPSLRTKFLKWLDDLSRDMNTASESASAATVVAKVFRGVAPVTTVAATIPGLGSITHVLPVQWPVADKFRCTVSGTVHSKKKGKKLWALSARPVPKNIALKFTATTNAKGPYEIRWQVANTGPEAIVSNGLRGDFYQGEGADGAVRWEETSYAGTHWAEAFVIQNGQCIARSGKKWVRIKP